MLLRNATQLTRRATPLAELLKPLVVSRPRPQRGSPQRHHALIHPRFYATPPPQVVSRYVLTLVDYVTY